MARQVYFDPFGSYTQGFDQGAGRQIQTEGASRSARAQDFDFNNLAPYRVNAAQREDELGKTTLPYQQALAPFALDTARNNLFDTQVRQATQFAPLFRNTAPLEQAYYRHYNLTPATTQVEGGPPTTQLFGVGPDGQTHAAGAPQANLSQNVLDYLNWQRNIQARTLDDNQQYRAGALQNAATKNDYYGVGQNARMVGAYSKYYQGNGGINGGSLFGGNMPTDLANPGYYQQPLGGQPGGANPTGPNDLQDYNIGNQ